jgi:hypothetical protein
MALFAIGCRPFIMEQQRQEIIIGFDGFSGTIEALFFLSLLRFFFSFGSAAAADAIKLCIGRKPKGIISELLHCHIRLPKIWSSAVEK